MDFSYDNLVKQEQQLVLPEFNSDVAYKLGMMMIDRAKKEGKVIAVSITVAKQNMFHYAQDGLGPDADNWIRRKSNVVYEYQKSSLLIGLKLERENSTLIAHGRNPNDFMVNGGSFPIIVKGAGVIGAITVTGLPHWDDHEYVTMALAEHLGVSIQ
ncbi:MAG: heme-degrading domain-containing protein [Oscillospiraceae bacterium]|nr:heme-degrading domain-containing protein [Oscillospiraceae bacterium]